MSLIGKVVTYTDPFGVRHDALVTQDWGHDYRAEDLDETVENGRFTKVQQWCLNLAYCDPVPDAKDPYGRQLVRVTSIGHRSAQGTCPGNFWTATRNAAFVVLDPDQYPKPA
jgi:hypothetical protein